MKDNTNQLLAFIKTQKTVRSCTNVNHFAGAGKMVKLYEKKYLGGERNNHLRDLFRKIKAVCN